MPENQILEQAPLEAKNPFVLRVNLGQNVPDAEARAALASGDMGFLHSFTTGSTVDGPGVRLVAWTAGCQLRCLYCHNPDTWNMMNGMAVTLDRAVQELAKKEGRQFQSLVDEAFTDLVEKHRNARPQPEMMGAYFASVEKFLDTFGAEHLGNALPESG